MDWSPDKPARTLFSWMISSMSSWNDQRMHFRDWLPRPSPHQLLSSSSIVPRTPTGFVVEYALTINRVSGYCWKGICLRSTVSVCCIFQKTRSCGRCCCFFQTMLLLLIALIDNNWKGRWYEGTTIGRFRRTLLLSWLTAVWMTGSIKSGVSVLIKLPWWSAVIGLLWF